MSAVIKIGIERSKIGDILVDEDGADIFVFDLNSNYIIQGLSELTRFKKSNIEKIGINEARRRKENFEKFTIIVSSMRIDNIVSELVSCSRNKASELIEEERVLVNYETVLKNSKVVEFGNIVTIRGKGKFIVDGLVRNTRGDRLILEVRKYA
ncbi:MAG: YlmH/Sll1252 family protein [Clostridia bacterium]